MAGRSRVTEPADEALGVQPEPSVPDFGRTPVARYLDEIGIRPRALLPKLTTSRETFENVRISHLTFLEGGDVTIAFTEMGVPGIRCVRWVYVVSWEQ